MRDAGLVTEIELPGPTRRARCSGLLVHGDVQPVEDGKWTIPPSKGVVRDGQVLGRGSADDKGPLVQALLAMAALCATARSQRTHTIRLLVGSDEESGNKDIATYLKTHQPPDYSLVLDSAFPVVVGEKAWNALYLTTPLGERPGGTAVHLRGDGPRGRALRPASCPTRPRSRCAGRSGAAGLAVARRGALRGRRLPTGIKLEVSEPRAIA